MEVTSGIDSVVNSGRGRVKLGCFFSGKIVSGWGFT